MGIINVLDFQVANLIAAGEVVDRPASVVKELIENSIDAGANNITVEIKNGGISFIRISDNGKGMSRDDLIVCTKRHATSKIKNAGDLDGIMTLGFRGEALAAIASVSKLRIMTKQFGELMGNELQSEAGEILDVIETGCQDGTTVIVEELFANVPARRKFLKRDISEAMAVSAVVEKVALSRPEIAFKLIIDGMVKYSTAGDGELLNTMYALLGKDFAKKTSKVCGLTDGIEVNGYVGTPENCRANRNYQNFFVNGRYVKSKTAMAALEQAFNSFIPSDKFPCCVLNIIIHPAYVDVNVHPAKLEIKFSNEKLVFDAVYCAVRNTLTNNLKRPEYKNLRLTSDDVRLLPDNNIDKVLEKYSVPQKLLSDSVSETGGKLESESVSVSKELMTAPKQISEINPKFPMTLGPTFLGLPDIEYEEIPKKNPSSKIESETKKTPEDVPLPYYKILGVAFNSYVFIELSDSVLVVDKHAAHERIIFEDMKHNLKNKAAMEQMLFIPFEIPLSDDEIAAMSEYKNEILSIGFDFTLSEKDKSVSVFQIPSEIETSMMPDIITELAGKLSDGTATVNTAHDVMFEKALYQASCKAAVKAGHDDNIEHVKWICEKLLSLPDIKYCPHGRPVAYEMPKRDIEKNFHRI